MKICWYCKKKIGIFNPYVCSEQDSACITKEGEVKPLHYKCYLRRKAEIVWGNKK